MTRMSRLQRMDVVDREGNRLGRVFDLRTSHGSPDEPPRLEGLLVGRGGLARRLGIRRGSARMVPVSDIVSIEDRTIVVASRAE